MDSKQSICHKMLFEYFFFPRLHTHIYCCDYGSLLRMHSHLERRYEKRLAKPHTYICIPSDKWIKRIVSYYFYLPKGK